MSVVSYKYASSLWEVAIETNAFEEIYLQFTSFFKAYESSEELKNSFLSKMIGNKDKKEILIKLNIIKSDILLNFIKLLIDKSRIDFISEIYDDFKTLYFQHKNILNIEIVSAYTLKDETISIIEKKLMDKYKKDIVLTKSVDESIGGGIILYVGNEMIDLSINTKLENMKSILKQTKIV